MKLGAKRAIHSSSGEANRRGRHPLIGLVFLAGRGVTMQLWQEGKVQGKGVKAIPFSDPPAVWFLASPSAIRTETKACRGQCIFFKHAMDVLNLIHGDVFHHDIMQR